MAGLVAPAAVAALGALLGGRPAAASIMIALDLPTMVQQADHIAVVEVEGIKAAWDDRHERIYSTIDLKVIENWKGTTGAATTQTPSATGRLTVVQPGGTVDDIHMTVTGMGTFVPGERSLVFLRGPANRAQVVGMTQGKRAMRYEATARTWVVTPPDLRQTKLVRPPVGRPVAAPIATKPLATKPAPLQSVPSQRTPTAAPVQSVTQGTGPLNVARELPVDDVRAEIMRLLGAVR